MCRLRARLSSWIASARSPSPSIAAASRGNLLVTWARSSVNTNLYFTHFFFFLNQFENDVCGRQTFVVQDAFGQTYKVIVEMFVLMPSVIINYVIVWFLWFIYELDKIFLLCRPKLVLFLPLNLIGFWPRWSAFLRDLLIKKKWHIMRFDIFWSGG